MIPSPPPPPEQLKDKPTLVVQMLVVLQKERDYQLALMLNSAIAAEDRNVSNEQVRQLDTRIQRLLSLLPLP